MTLKKYRICIDENEDRGHLSNMYVVCRDVFLCVAIFTLFVMVSFESKDPEITKLYKPRKFFTKKSPFVDVISENNFDALAAKGAKFDVTFFMIYAPWDDDSHNARSHYENTCSFFSSKIYCPAIDCWRMKDKCRGVFKEAKSYPSFLARTKLLTVAYTGIRESSHMIKFVTATINPIRRITTPSKFQNMRNLNQVLIVAYLPLSNDSDRVLLRQYYEASLKYLEHDPTREICWAIISDQATANVAEITASTIKMFSWNDTQEFVGNVSRNNIVNWVLQNAKYVTKWLYPEVEKEAFFELLHQRPSVIVFTPRNMYFTFQPVYLLVLEAALDYYDCSDQNSLFAERLQYISNERRDFPEKLRVMEAQCAKRDDDSCTLDPASSPSFYFWSKFHESGTVTPVQAPIVVTEAANVTEAFMKETCDRYKQLRQITFHIPDYEEEEGKDSYYDSAPPLREKYCNFPNATLSFVLLDSDVYDDFARYMGINLNEIPNRTTAALISNEDEIIRVMAEPLSKKTLQRFITNHYLRPELDVFKKSSPLRKKGPFPVLELNANTFRSEVFDSNYYIVVFFYTPRCSYCRTVERAFLSAAIMLENHFFLKFAQIEVNSNDISTQFKPLRYPSIVVFPLRKSESVTFPVSMEMTQDNIMSFAMGFLDDKSWMEVKLRNCICLYKDHKNSSEEKLGKPVKMGSGAYNSLTREEYVEKHGSEYEKCFWDLQQECISKIDFTNFQATYFKLRQLKVSPEHVESTLGKIKKDSGYYTSLYDLTERYLTHTEDVKVDIFEPSPLPP